ncbi:MAG: cold-shock protein [Deltaproteobacteria bacterium CG_4_10_14_3_um_filter_60_8]|nr:MAG: cold-shock protein [Desulfobacterales bacterium CG2_30_60_27]PIP43016.1 MAG: cold-shock protein [Deltaproteobacteria bacterium CG23_combo_of_CG06-09_8_20_14_all_60_8]PIY24267.1 MAG: cold-shock protein [Deltaproteobacteria bacterium CG_4_10_14_3_um_filter_60_8]
MELHVEARNMEMRKSWQDKIDQEKERLVRHHPGLVHNLRITIDETSHHQGGGYELRLVASVPNDTVVVKRKGETVRPMLVEAFDTLGLQLKELQRKRRQPAKAVEEGEAAAQSTGIIKALYPFESYGFIATASGREVYFHENALKSVALAQLAEGDAVRFGESDGDKGPCATWVRLAK